MWEEEGFGRLEEGEGGWKSGARELGAGADFIFLPVGKITICACEFFNSTL